MEKYSIDEILEMLSSHNEKSIQERGMLEAQKIKTLLPFCMPREYCDSWNNCAKLLSSKTDKELEEYLPYLFEWVLEIDINVPGGEIIQNRLKKFDHNNYYFKGAFVKAIHNIDFPNFSAFETIYIDQKSNHDLIYQFIDRKKNHIKNEIYSFRSIDDDIFYVNLSLVNQCYKDTNDLDLFIHFDYYQTKDFFMKQYEMLLIDDKKNELFSITQKYKFPIRASRVFPGSHYNYIFENCKYEIQNKYTLIINYVDENDNSNFIKLNIKK